MLRAPTPSPITEKLPLTGRVGFDNLVHEEVFERLPAWISAQPDDKSRVWGVNSFAALPAFGGKFDEAVAQQCGRRMPAASRNVKGTHSGLRLAVVDPDATATAPRVRRLGKSRARGAARQT